MCVPFKYVAVLRFCASWTCLVFCQVFGSPYRTRRSQMTPLKRPNLPSCWTSLKTDPRYRESTSTTPQNPHSSDRRVLNILNCRGSGPSFKRSVSMDFIMHPQLHSAFLKQMPEWHKLQTQFLTPSKQAFSCSESGVHFSISSLSIFTADAWDR